MQKFKFSRYMLYIHRHADESKFKECFSDCGARVIISDSTMINCVNNSVERDWDKFLYRRAHGYSDYNHFKNYIPCKKCFYETV